MLRAKAHTPVVAMVGVAFLSGCLSTPRSARPTLTPNDPTPLAKCKVAASQSSPLVTEWPATEKSRLEALVAQGGVVVAYSGCEMRVLPDCRVKGQYAYTRTTLATDTTEVADADDLYTKLPLGAVSLEGDLNRSGRLAVQTTVVGELLLKDAGPGDVPKDGACSDATHLVTGLSLGVFRLLAGGKMSASASGKGFGGKVGGGRIVEESVLRETGDAKACAEGDASKPSDRCKSPLQVFLAPLPGREAPSVARKTMAEEKPPEGAVRVNFKVDEADEKWTLVTKDEKFVCELPCSRWVGPNSGLQLKLDAAKQADVKTVVVPAQLGYTAGRMVDASPRVPGLKYGWLVLTLGCAAFGGGLAVAGEASTGEAPFNGKNPLGLVGFSVLGLAGIATFFTSIFVFSEQRDVKLDVSLASDVARTRVGPRYAAVKLPSLGVSSVVTPFGVVGSF